jgi:D-glycero-D-manno-heptose 1,7-bisphosphate phosphatase
MVREQIARPISGQGNEAVRAAFLDRDGTLIKDYPDTEWSTRTEPEWLPQAFEAAAAIAALGYKLVIVTNQYLIGEGFVTRAEYERFAAIFLEVLRPIAVNGLAVYYCPHPRSTACECSKPGRGMIDQATSEDPRIDISRSLLVGDSATDVALGKRLGIETYGINIGGAPGYGRRVESLAEAAKIITGGSVLIV